MINQADTLIISYIIILVIIMTIIFELYNNYKISQPKVDTALINV